MSDWCSDVFSSDLLSKLFNHQWFPPLRRMRGGAHRPDGPSNSTNQINPDHSLCSSFVLSSFHALSRLGGSKCTQCPSPLPLQPLRFRSTKSTPRGIACISILQRSEEHTSELQSLMRTSYAVFCLKKNKNNTTNECT